MKYPAIINQCDFCKKESREGQDVITRKFVWDGDEYELEADNKCWKTITSKSMKTILSKARCLTVKPPKSVKVAKTAKGKKKVAVTADPYERFRVGDEYLCPYYDGGVATDLAHQDACGHPTKAGNGLAKHFNFKHGLNLKEAMAAVEV